MSFSDLTKKGKAMYAARFEPDGVRTLAELFWRALLLLSTIFVVLSLLYGIWNLFGILQALSQVSGTTPTPKQTFNASTLHAVAERFQARKTLFETFTPGSVPSTLDPGR